MSYIRLALSGAKLAKKLAPKAKKSGAKVIGHSKAYIKRTYGGHEANAFRQAARRNRRKKR